MNIGVVTVLIPLLQPDQYPGAALLLSGDHKRES
jgi:hypothetical protein